MGTYALHRCGAVGVEDGPCQIERASNQDTRRRLKLEAADRGECRLDVLAALRRNANAARDIGDRIGESFIGCSSSRGVGVLPM